MFGTRTILSCVVAGLTLGLLGEESNIDPQRRFAWSENAGWTNWRDAGGGHGGVFVRATFLSGFIWSENAGWIHVGDGNGPYRNRNGRDFGVNVDPDTGVLSGFAWGENVGWINFDTLGKGADAARFDACGRTFTGFVWAENIGWLRLGDMEHPLGVGPCERGDIDCDRRIDLTDYRAMAGRLSGPDVDVDCAPLDFDGDRDVDLRDVAFFQNAFGR